MNKLKQTEQDSYFKCVDCGDDVHSYLLKSIEQNRCIKCREKIAKRKLGPFE